MLFVASAYLLIGLAFSQSSGLAATMPMRAMWRALAWLFSGAAFAAHIAYEQFGLRNLPRTTAMHASFAAALGAGGLAIAANLHEWMTAPRYRPLMAIALVAWPLLTGIPAFVVAIIAAALLNRWRRTV